MARKIGKRAKTAKVYATLRAKQKMANEFLYGAKNYLKADHKAIVNAKARKKRFYNKRGLKNPSRLSFKNLTKKDLIAYENLLDSIIESTYLNPEKYKSHLERIRENLSNQVLDAFGGSAEDYDDFIESDIFKMLIDLGVDPSSLVRYMQEFVENGFTMDDFITAAKAFIKAFNEGTYTADMFFEYMDDYQDKNSDSSNSTGDFDDIVKQAKSWYSKTYGKGNKK